jgi:hypothetical protein
MEVNSFNQNNNRSKDRKVMLDPNKDFEFSFGIKSFGQLFYQQYTSFNKKEEQKNPSSPRPEEKASNSR